MWMKSAENTLALSTTSCNLVTNKAPDNATCCTHIHKLSDKFARYWQISLYFCLSLRTTDYILAQQPSHTDTCVQLVCSVFHTLWHVDDNQHPSRTYTVRLLHLTMFSSVEVIEILSQCISWEVVQQDFNSFFKDKNHSMEPQRKLCKSGVSTLAASCFYYCRTTEYCRRPLWFQCV